MYLTYIIYFKPIYYFDRLDQQLVHKGRLLRLILKIRRH